MHNQGKSLKRKDDKWNKKQVALKSDFNDFISVQMYDVWFVDRGDSKQP